MKLSSTRAIVCTVLSVSASVYAANVGSPFYGDPPDDHHPWCVHDRNRPQPAVVTPGTFSTLEQPGKPPSDAIILFDGTDLSKWEADEGTGVPTKWIVKDGAMECVPKSGQIRTKDKLGDIQLHIEWAAPAKVQGDSQGRGNSGVFLMNTYELQVLDSFDNPTYFDGQAGSIYKQTPPQVNATRAPGTWNAYDVIWTAPRFNPEGTLKSPAFITALHNGVLILNHFQLKGDTPFNRAPQYKQHADRLPIRLQDHGNPMRFRNIWVREIKDAEGPQERPPYLRDAKGQEHPIESAAGR